MGTYEEIDDAWLIALTRQRRAEAAARVAPVRYSVRGCEFTPSIEVSPATSRSKTRAKRWRGEQWRLGNRRCFYCDDPLRRQGRHTPCGHPKLATVDHRHPLALGGDDAAWNFAMCCNACNGAKGQMTEAEFRASMGLARAA